MVLYHKYFFIPLALLTSSVASSQNDVVTKQNKDSGLLSWSINQDGFSIELIQLLPDFVRAIYENHHFPAVEIERIANYCVFGTIIKNTLNEQLSYKVSNWTYGFNDRTYRVKTKTQWLAEWKKSGIIFSWTLLPDVGQFEVGDWQQGFTTIQLPPKSTFDLNIQWYLKDRVFNLNIPNVSCAPATLSL